MQIRYDEFARTYDQLDSGPLARGLGFPELRQELVSQAAGRVLETGVGTGINLPFYSRHNIDELTVVDESEGMLSQARAKAGLIVGAENVNFVQADVQQLPFADNSFDSVVDTFSLCVYSEPVQALREMSRVLKPGGKLYLLEHSRSGNAALAAYQDFTSTAVAAAGKGCVWNQELPQLLRDAGLYALREQRHLAGTVTTLTALAVDVKLLL